MDPPKIVKTFKYNSSQQPMFSVLETPLHYRSFQEKDSTSFEDISFSSYLKSQDPSQKSQENAAIDDTEISIFDAQKYFSENSDPKDIMRQQKQDKIHDQMMSVPRMSSVSSVDGYGRNFRTRSFHATPTASSEASWNSQTGLLANPPGSIGVSLRNISSDDTKKKSSIAKKWIFGRKCCCTGKKSIQVKEVSSENSENSENLRDSHKGKESPSMSKKCSITNEIMEIHHQKVIIGPNSLRDSPENHFPVTDPPRQQRISASGRPFRDGIEGFSFPILNPSTQPIKPAMEEIKTKATINHLKDSPRDSLDVFQPIDERPSISRPPSIDNPLINPRQHFNLGSPIARDDDVGSDASSDLFEIESFSTQTTSYPMYRRRDSLDEAPTFNARRFAAANGGNNNVILNDRRSLDDPECYAPSEVSIDWSVTTAEGFDRASVSNFSISASEFGSAAGGSGGESGKRKGNGGLLLMSCRQEKAVSVGPQPVKYAAAEGPPILPLHVGGRPPRGNKPPLGSDHSARLSVAFAA